MIKETTSDFHSVINLDSPLPTDSIFMLEWTNYNSRTQELERLKSKITVDYKTKNIEP